MDGQSLEGGFDDPVMDAQRGFRAIMDALANPGTLHTLDLGLTPPAPLPAECAAVALTLCDPESPIWLDPAFENAAVLAWLRFHTGAPIISDRSKAAFALVSTASSLAFADFTQGDDLYPDRSTTIVLAVPALSGGAVLCLKGPGIQTEITITPMDLSADFLDQWSHNNARFPRGIDLLLVAENQVIGLPRTTRIEAKGA
ncbi:phosphonate C-P lyase system protein PhnH [Devosia algicola]|uniref:Phosphonate C-P lyase system protein PhnH n=2 Tax=Devosia algicola TaxID=3026418 RepID=A0ABY7YT06_9HYPH|nr:phosphonate C-P lyase system protein PhnH [Devosia algicola]